MNPVEQTMKTAPKCSHRYMRAALLIPDEIFFVKKETTYNYTQLFTVVYLSCSGDLPLLRGGDLY